LEHLIKKLISDFIDENENFEKKNETLETLISEIEKSSCGQFSKIRQNLYDYCKHEYEENIHHKGVYDPKYIKKMWWQQFSGK
jgi:transcriptional antiterminator